MLHACVVCNSLWAETEAEYISGVWTVSHQKRTVRLPFQFQLRVLPVHRSPVPATLMERQIRHLRKYPSQAVLVDFTRRIQLSQTNSTDIIVSFNLHVWWSPLGHKKQSPFIRHSLPEEFKYTWTRYYYLFMYLFLQVYILTLSNSLRLAVKLLESTPLRGHTLEGGATLIGGGVSIGDGAEWGSARKKASRTERRNLPIFKMFGFWHSFIG